MRRGSLRLRLAVGGMLAILVALTVAGFGLAILFERHARRVLDEELQLHLRQLAGGLEPGPAGPLGRPPADPRFQTPLSGLYWQVEPPEGAALRSRSLWDERLAVSPGLADDGTTRREELVGPAGEALLVAERQVRVDGRAYRLAVGADLAGLKSARDAFMADLVPGLALLALVLGTAGWIQITAGLEPLARLRAGVARLNRGKAERLDPSRVEEVHPLVAELNALLDARDLEIERARRRAADLAHGLKTPLAALSGDAERLRRKGEVEIAAAIETVGDTMRRHVERELARARLAQAPRAGPAAIPVAAALAPLIETLRRTPEGQRIDFVVDIAPEATTDLGRDELLEVVGNLAENAARHAAGTVRISGRRTATGRLSLLIEDDGPGIAEADRARALERGLRLDETGPGTGLGLAIVREVLVAHGLGFELTRSDLGGLAARFDLESAATGAAPGAPPPRTAS